jgi:hypothetical protein
MQDQQGVMDLQLDKTNYFFSHFFIRLTFCGAAINEAQTHKNF